MSSKQHTEDFALTATFSYLHRVWKKKSLQYFQHIFDKLKPIFVIFGKSRPEYSLD